MDREKVCTVDELVRALLVLPQDSEVWRSDSTFGLSPVHPIQETLDGMHWPWTEQRRRDWDNGDETEFKVVSREGDGGLFTVEQEDVAGETLAFYSVTRNGGYGYWERSWDGKEPKMVVVIAP